MFTDDLVVEDHRLVGMGRIDNADDYTASLVALWELAPVTRAELGWAWPAADRHGAIAALRRTGTVPDGGEFESEYLYLYLVEQGRINHVELFEMHALDEALERFEALRPDPLSAPPNGAVRAHAAISSLIANRDTAALRSFTSEDFCYHDRSKASLVQGGVEEWLRAIDFFFMETGARLEARVVATAGDRLVLHHMFIREAPGDANFEIETFRVMEFDAAGKLRAFIRFDSDQRAEASAELVERWLAIGDVPLPLARYIRAWNDHDLERVGSLLPEYFDDHRRTGVGRLAAGDYLESLRALYELSEDVRIEPLYEVARGSHGLLMVHHWFGTNAEGGDFEAVYVALMHVEHDRIVRLELFEPEDLDEARARFEEVGSATAI
jgi:ketosteroid isomerase-like protein